MEYTVNDIQHDTDGVVVDLPNELKITVPSNLHYGEDIEEYVSNEISNITGYCHRGFTTIPEIKY